MEQKPQSPFAEERVNQPFRFSFASLLLLTVVAAGMASAFYYASRIPDVSREVNAIFGRSIDASASESRFGQLNFLLFCYASPLLLTGVLGLGTRILLWAKRRNAALDSDDDEFSWPASTPKTSAS